MSDELRHNDIAIVGIGCRFPGGAHTPASFWKMLCDGVDAISELPSDRFDLDDLFDPDPATPGKIYTRWGGFVEGIDEFDADFFGISPREVRRMDPQHRLLLEVVWEAFEDAGVVPEQISGTNAGVFIGISTQDYAHLHMRPGYRTQIDAHLNIGNALCAAANRISYLFDLHGPSFAVESACSSSLTAVHLACRSIRHGEADMAIVGGVNVVLAPELTIGFCKASMISPDGRCRAFDAGANGYVRSEGAGVVVLKSLSRALEDNDPIYALIRGTAINEDGRTAGISLPNGDAQERLLRQALREAGVSSSAIQYVEAHGTGTAAGDPIEAGALGRVFGAGRTPENPCLIGSAKTNVGHLEAGAGITGLIKTALSLKHRRIPPSLHFREPNPEIPFDDLHLRVATTLSPWPSSEGPAMAGVNAFGFGGSNAHVILQEPPQAVLHGEPHRQDSPHLLTVSARTLEALRSYAERYVHYLREETAVPLHDLCFTASRRRTHHEHRLSVVGSDRGEFIEHLEDFLKKEDRAELATGRAHRTREPRLAFAFSGMGPQWWGMGRWLLAEEPVFREALEECDRLLRPISGWSLLDELGKSEAESRIARADLAHVANFAVQVALTALWRSWGVVPDAVVGHSSGDIAAACVAGALELRDALFLAYHRGRLQHELAGTGGMLAASISSEEAASVIAGLEERVSLAALNSPTSVTLSGEVEALERIVADLERSNVFCRLLQVDIPYHGPHMAAIRDELLDVLRDLTPRRATLPYVSSTTGEWIEGHEVDRIYWWQNVRAPVRFETAVNRLLDDGCEIFLEIGPHPVLAVYLTECLASQDRTADVLPTLRRMEDEYTDMLRSVGALHARGRRVDWSGIYATGTCVPLPPYPWQRERFWLESAAEEPASRPAGPDTGHPLLGRRISSPEPGWEADLNDARIDYLDAHVVQESVVFPGAGYVEMMLAAATRLCSGVPVSLENVEFRKLLFLETPREVVLQLHQHRRDGSLEVHSAPKGENPAWTLHATAMLNRYAAVETGRLDVEAVRKRCTTEMPVAEHFHALALRGFRYGSAFRGLREIRFGEGEAIARIGRPDDLDLFVDAYGVHPALLDAAFQAAAAAASLDRHDAQPSGPVFPVGIKRVTYHARAGERFWAHVAVRESGEAFPEGDVVLVDDAGNVCVSYEGLRMKLLEESRPEGIRQKADWLYELRWEEMPLQRAAAGPGPRMRRSSEVRAAVASDSGRPEDAPDVRHYYDTVAPDLDRIASGFALAALKELGWQPDRDVGTPAGVLVEALGIVPRHHRLFAELVGMLGSPDVLSRDPLGPAARNGASLHRLLDDVIARAPDYGAEAELLRRGGDRLADMLRGAVDAREVLLTGESRDLLWRMYHESPACRRYHSLLGDVVAAGWNVDSAPLRILEVGAGTGAATAAVLPRLPASAQYVFTDISPYFFAQAQAHLQDHPGLRFSRLDLEKDPVEQGYGERGFDLVLAANVLHTTEDLRTSLGHLRKLLAPGGMLVLLELTRRSLWLNMVFGLLDGWWRFTDLDLRPDYPLLDAPAWRMLLEESGFVGVTSLFEDDAEDALQTIVLAHAPQPAAADGAPTTEMRRKWLVLADRNGTGRQVSQVLQAQCHDCRIAFPGEAYRRRGDGTFELPGGDPAAIIRLLHDLRADGHAPDGVIHLWSLDDPGGEERPADAVMDAQQFGCESALALVKALEKAEGHSPEIWLVTSGSQAVDDDVPRLSQATLWGMGRVLRNEQAGVGCRLVDLGPEGSAEEIEALVEELIAASGEEEVALRGGRRLVRRLHRISLDRIPRRESRDVGSPAQDVFHLEIGTPGALDTLVLREHQPVEPGAGELVIRVMVSGLNFREVLQALDMLPPGAEGAASQGLGVECAGIVLACGESVEDFRPGDEVIALASPAHASRAVAPAYLTVRKPEHLSFAEAATIVNAFVTADYSLNHVARIAPGERVLVHSAAGAVGHAAIQICRAAGAKVFATAGTVEKRAHLLALGVEHVMDSRSLDFYDEILRDTGGEGVDIVLNALTGEAMQKSLALLRPYGRFVELGKRDIYQNGRLGLEPFRRNLTYTAVDLMQLAVDRPEFANRMLRRVVERVADGIWTPVPHTVFDLAEAEKAFRWMAQARHIGKIVLTVGEPQYAVVPLREQSLCRPDATYLITGGLGGFGLAAAEWLVRRGARNLVLMSRSGAPKENRALLDALQASPASVVVARGDVSDERDVAQVLDRIRREMPPLRGILHAAMVLDDDVLVHLDERRMRTVMAPKVAGAWNLHRLSRQDEIDFFVPFSSIASVIGHPMQGNYAAANAFLDTLASHRRALRLPALSIGWGAVAGVGYVSRHPDVAQYLDRSGFGRFAPDEALDALDVLLQHEIAHVVAARLDWSTWAEKNPVAASSKRFLPVVATSGRSVKRAAEQPSEALQAALASAAPEQRGELLEAYLRQKIAGVLGTTPQKIDPERPLTELGFDSLMAVELVTAFKVDLGIKVPVVKILRGTNGRDLAESLLEQLFRDAEEADQISDEETAGASPARSEEHGDAPDTWSESLRESGTAAPADAGYPLSFEQRRFWIFDQLEPGNAAYNLPAAARLTGPLDVHALERSLSEVLRRHEILRAAIREVDGEPVQVFAPGASPVLPVIDLHAYTAAEREFELQRQATESIQRPFDLREGPLLRATLFRIDQDEHVILLVVHHIACDAWSMNMLVREIAVLYEAFSEGRPSPLSEPPGRYPDYVRRQQELLSDERVESQLAYWKSRLAGAPAALRLPTLKAQSSTSSGGHRRFELSRELTDLLQALSADEGVTLFMTLMAAFQALLYRYAGDDDICVGTAVSTRNGSEDSDVAGCYMNTVVLRSDLSGEPTFRQLLHRVRKTTLEAFEHGDVPFDRVVEVVRPERDPGRTPLFQAMLVLHNARLPALRLKRLVLEPVDVESGTAVADVMLLADLGERLTGMLEYSTELLDAEAAERMLGHFVTLLEGIVDDLDQPVPALPLLSAAERHPVLVSWNDTAVDFGGPPCLHEHFEAQAKETPDAVAVVSGDERLTYRELDRRANQLALHLAELGVGTDIVVGVCCTPSVERVVAMLGILKACGAFLPLDPDDAPERLGVMVRDAEVPVLLTQRGLSGWLAAHGLSGSLSERSLSGWLPEHGPTLVLLDDDREVASRERNRPPASRATAEDLAYVIYTSGSTGAPKGVMITHGAICNQVNARQTAFPLGSSDAVLQRTPVGFDPSIWEVFGPLCAGARVVMPPMDAGRDAPGLVRLIDEEQITVLQLVPSLLSVLLEEPSIKTCSALRHVFCGGEPLTAPLRDRFFERLPGVALHNLYGPTEAAIDATSWTCPQTNAPPVVPIGRPVANVQTYVLDDRRQPVPLGVCGELYLGGAGIGRGYLDAPGLTAERFIPNPYSEVPGARLYRTGDQVRRRPDGTLEFLGRRDEQVKIRGRRVEPAEVAAVLMQHPEVREAMVITREGKSRDRRLVAYVVAGEDRDLRRDALQAYAAKRLPSYMLPSEVVFVADFPRLASGKVDGRALVASEEADTGRDRLVVAPREPVELQLVQLWEDLLETRPIGVTDNFFDLGGHSLMAMRLMSHIRREFGSELPLASLVHHGTVEHLARLLLRTTSPATPSPVVAIQPRGSGPPLVCVHPSSGSIMCYMDLVRSLGTDRPVYAIQSPALDGNDEPRTQIEEMATEYVKALRSVQEEGPYVLGGWSMGAMVAFEMACQLQEQGEEVASLALFDPPSVAKSQLDGENEVTNVLTSFAQSMGLSPVHYKTDDRFRHLKPAEQLEYVLDQIQRAHLVPDDVDAEKLHRFLHVHTVNMEALRRYRPRPFTGHCSVFASGGKTGEHATDGADGWEELAKGGVSRYAVPGDHYSILREPSVQVLVRQLKSAWKDATVETMIG